MSSTTIIRATALAGATTAATLALGGSAAAAPVSPAKAAKAVRAVIQSARHVDADIPFGPRIRSVDVNGDRRVDGIVVDSDRDGRWDGGYVDAGRDGRLDLVWRDFDDDGRPGLEEVSPLERRGRQALPPVDGCGALPRLSVVDRDGDRRADSVRLDLDRDGRWDGTADDRDGDGIVDRIWVDRNRDGRVQQRELRWLGAAAAHVSGCLDRSWPELVQPLAASVRLDGDDEEEQVVGDPALGVFNAYARDLDGDGDPDVVVVGTKDGGKVVGTGNVDNDPRDQEVIVEDPTLLPGQSYGRDLDGDGDIDVVVVGTNGGGTTKGTENVDNDGAEDEVVVEDPTILPGQSYGLDLDGDGDHDVVVVGTGS